MNTTPSAPEAQLYAAGDRANCPLPSTGKYWAWRFGVWLRVEVLELPARGGTGTLAYAPRSRSHPWRGKVAVHDCQAFYGPVRAWGDTSPRVSRKRLLELGLGFYFPRSKPDARPRAKARAPQAAPARTQPTSLSS